MDSDSNREVESNTLIRLITISYPNGQLRSLSGIRKCPAITSQEFKFSKELPLTRFASYDIAQALSKAFPNQAKLLTLNITAKPQASMDSMTAMDGIMAGAAILILGGGIFMLLSSMYDIGGRM